jgi:hypothetical protein
MANRYPLILNAAAGQLQELPTGDSLDLGGESILGVGNLTVGGDFTVSGTTTNINTVNLLVEDKNIVIGDVASPTNTTADGGGITLKGAADKTISWLNATSAWTFSEHVSIASTKEYRIAGTKVLDATGLGSAVVSSSLTSVGTIGTGVWNGSVIGKAYLDATVISTGDTGTVTSTMILDGTILNADVNASAAIAGTKISPDFGSQTVTTTGVISSALGAAATPSITFTGDLSTGIYSPGANQVAVATNGTGRLFVSSTGTVGINTNETGFNGQGLPLIVGSGSGNLGLTIYSGNNDFGTVQFADTATTGADSYRGVVSYKHGDEYMYFSTNATEKLRITSLGLVGIGTSSPGAKLEVNGNITNTIGCGGTFILYDAVVNRNNSIRLGADASGAYINATYSVGGTGVLRFQTVGVERGRFDESGRLGIGTSAPTSTLHIQHAAQTAGYWEGKGLLIHEDATANQGIALYSRGGNEQYIASLADDAASYLIIGTRKSSSVNGVDAITIRGDGKVGIGTTSPTRSLEVAVGVTSNNGILVTGNNSPGILITETSGSVNLNLVNDANSAYIGTSSNHPVVLRTNNTERVRLDTSGRFLVGTSSGRAVGFTSLQAPVQVETTTAAAYTAVNNTNDANGCYVSIAKTRGTSAGAVTAVQNNDELGAIRISGSDGTGFVVGAQIIAAVDGTPGTNDLPTRLTFSTTADGASSPTERMRITSGGDFLFGKTTNVASDNGAIIGTLGQSFSVASQGFQGNGFHRNGNDGGIIGFFQDGTQEGSISVSGTTVSYNGAHLSRWSQLASGAERIEILRGSVLSNIDEMCEWGEEDNEQLNRMKVSDVEGDKNVSGVFQAWDDDDDTYTNDFYCAMTGDFIIRIAEGVTVERGDLLMSAGDGTAKPQDDDIIRSKTIAKVTSTNVSCTYEDGSYCVPCVLMAC